MSDSLRERMAWAVCPVLLAADECDMPEIINGPRPDCRQCSEKEPGGGTAGCRVVADLAVRAVLEAIRDPDEAMRTAGGNKHSGNDYFSPQDFPDEAGTIWRAMIDEVLRDV